MNNIIRYKRCFADRISLFISPLFIWCWNSKRFNNCVYSCNEQTNKRNTVSFYFRHLWKLSSDTKILTMNSMSGMSIHVILVLLYSHPMRFLIFVFLLLTSWWILLILLRSPFSRFRPRCRVGSFCYDDCHSECIKKNTYQVESIPALIKTDLCSSVISTECRSIGCWEMWWERAANGDISFVSTSVLVIAIR